MGFEFDRTILGREQELGTYYVDRKRMIDFAISVGEDNPIYVDEKAAEAGPFGGLVGVPMFHSTLANTEMAPYVEIKYGTISIAAGQDCEYCLPIRPGDVLTISCCIEDIYEKTGRSGSMLFLIRRAVFTDSQGRKVLTLRHSSVFK